MLRPFRLALLKVGLFKKNDPFRFYPQYRKDKSQWLKQGGIITREFMILDDYSDSAGVAKGHYFHQDLRVANLIHEHNPKRHIDIASRIDGFVAHVAAFRKITHLGIILVPPHGLEVKTFLRVRFAQPLSVLHTSRSTVSTN